MAAAPDEIATALARISVLGALGEEARRRLVLAGSPVDLPAGKLLFQAGDVGDAAYVVLSGALEIRSHSMDGRDVRISALGVGAVVGEMAVLDGAPRSADVVAERRSRLWRIPRGALVAALSTDPQAALSLLVELSGRLRAANAALEANRLLDLGARLGRLLVAEGGPRGLVALTQTEMARRLGYSRERINRKLHGWVADGIVELGPAGVRVLNAERLAP